MFLLWQEYRVADCYSRRLRMPLPQGFIDLAELVEKDGDHVAIY